MKAFLQKYGRVAGGLYGIATAIALWYDMKPLGVTLAVCAIVLVASAEKLKKN